MAGPVGGDDAIDDVVQIELGGVDEFGGRRAVREHLGIEIAARVEDDVGAGQQSRGPHRQQVGGTRAGTDELHSPVVIHRPEV